MGLLNYILRGILCAWTMRVHSDVLWLHSTPLTDAAAPCRPCEKATREKKKRELKPFDKHSGRVCSVRIISTGQYFRCDAHTILFRWCASTRFIGASSNRQSLNFWFLKNFFFFSRSLARQSHRIEMHLYFHFIPRSSQFCMKFLFAAFDAIAFSFGTQTKYAQNVKVMPRRIPVSSQALWRRVATSRWQRRNEKSKSASRTKTMAVFHFLVDKFCALGFCCVRETMWQKAHIPRLVGYTHSPFYEHVRRWCCCRFKGCC